MVTKGKAYSPSVDAGLGLIFRLNNLWNRADNAALKGDMDYWNFVLDTIFRNLSYRGEMAIEKDNPREKDWDKVNVLSVDLAKKEKSVFEKFREMLAEVKGNKIKAIKTKDRALFEKSKVDEYNILMKKDIWLRKYMQQLKLYMKESEFDASRAMWGG